jgi:hypothetical protein
MLLHQADVAAVFSGSSWEQIARWGGLPAQLETIDLADIQTRAHAAGTVWGASFATPEELCHSSTGAGVAGS